MLQKFCAWMLYKRMGWSKDINQPHPNKYIICLAPHTSNWDFLIGQLFSGAEGLKINFLMKKEWFFWPLGPIFRKMGGIAVFRDRHTSMTDNLAETAKRLSSFKLCITPEGTRSLNPEWKKDFLLYRAKGRHTRAALRCRLYRQTHCVQEDHYTLGQHRQRYARDKTIFQRF